MKVYRIETGETDWVVADSATEAVETLNRLYQYTDELDGANVVQVPDDELICIYQDEPFREPTPSITKTAREWATEKGIIATTCV